MADFQIGDDNDTIFGGDPDPLEFPSYYGAGSDASRLLRRMREQSTGQFCKEPSCTNQRVDGGFDGEFCVPCANFHKGIPSPYSQAARNTAEQYAAWKKEQGIVEAPPVPAVPADINLVQKSRTNPKIVACNLCFKPTDAPLIGKLGIPVGDGMSVLAINIGQWLQSLNLRKLVNIRLTQLDVVLDTALSDIREVPGRFLSKACQHLVNGKGEFLIQYSLVSPVEPLDFFRFVLPAPQPKQGYRFAFCGGCIDKIHKQVHEKYITPIGWVGDETSDQWMTATDES